MKNLRIEATGLASSPIEIVNENDNVVARITGVEQDPELVANLFVASGDLLDALKRYTEVFEGEPAEPNSALEQARKAIDKAEGKC